MPLNHCPGGLFAQIARLRDVDHPLVQHGVQCVSVRHAERLVLSYPDSNHPRTIARYAGGGGQVASHYRNHSRRVVLFVIVQHVLSSRAIYIPVAVTWHRADASKRMLESGVGRVHNIALSTLENFRLPGDVSASKRYWKEDIIEPEVEVSRDGLIAIRDVPGTGYRVREDLIEKLTVKKETTRAGK